MPIGARVTLRGDKMYEFLDRFITSSLLEYVTLEVSIQKDSMVEETII